MSAEENQHIVRRFVEEGWNAGNMDVLDELLAPDFVNHDPANPASSDAQGMKQEVAAQHSAFPDMHVSTEDMVAQGDRVAKRSTFRGTHTGEWHGIPATGKQITVSTLSLYRIEGGKIQEIWWGYDVFGVLQQMGVIPEPAQTRG